MPIRSPVNDPGPQATANRSMPLMGTRAVSRSASMSRGSRVAICDQVEDPRKAKGIVKREIVRVGSPGTLTDASYLDAREPAFLMAIAPSDRDPKRVALQQPDVAFQGRDQTVASPFQGRDDTIGVALLDLS